VIAGIAATTACGSNSGSASAATAANGAVASPRDSTGAGAGAARGARPVPTITLAPHDVGSAALETIEEGTPITGDLHPIETVEVRARLEGDLVGVYAREGQRVTQGQLLAQFDAGEQVSAQRSAEADRASARTDLAATQ